MDWEQLFPAGTPVLALPNWAAPRLYLPARGLLGRWEKSGFYPASRLRGRAYRLLLRTRAAAGTDEVRVSRSDGWPAGEFVRSVAPEAASAAVLVGEPSPVQKATVRLWDAKGRIVGYLKYAEEKPARRRLLREHCVLSGLPAGLGPAPLKYGPLGGGEALVTTPLSGRHPPAKLPPTEEMHLFLRKLIVSAPVSLEDHPWVWAARRRSERDLDPWLEALSGRKWSVAVQHGDLTPWNVLRDADGALRAVDWEYGDLEGLPHLDLTHLLIQVSVLVYRWSPRKATEFAVACLAGGGLGGTEARAMVRLAAYDVHLKHREDGFARAPELQRWLRAVWEGAE